MATAGDLTLGLEWAVLELLCVGDSAGATSPGLDDLLASDELDWGELLGQALRHQMLPLLAERLLASSARSTAPFYVVHHLAGELELNRWRLLAYRKEAARLAAALGERGVRCVATKGITLEPTIYGGRGTRMLKDIDFMVLPEDREAAGETLASLGFAPGVYDLATGEVVPHVRRDLMRYLLHPDHLPRHARSLDVPCVPYVYVDVANSLTWSKAPYEVPVAVALAEPVALPLEGTGGATVPCFPPLYQFLFTVLHLFREAFLENWMGYGIDVSLMKFGDVIRLFSAHRQLLTGGSLARLLDEHRVAEPVLWVLEHLDRTFGTQTVESLGMTGRVDEAWLASAHPAQGRERHWTGDMRQRLHHKDRHALFAEADAGRAETRP